ncbi:MAG: DUF4238 domain-containing protein [Candidatus Paceibacterota bacterium]
MFKKKLKRVQHFVPRFILKKFLTSSEFKLFDKRYKKFLSKTPGGSMYKEYFYEHDDFNVNEVEDLISSRENLYAPIIEKLISREKLTLAEHKTLIEFRHITYYRSNEFIGFHTYKKDRGEGSSHQRLDWLRINGIFSFKNHEKDIKKSQLKAIQNVINQQDSAYQLSSFTPICFVAISNDRKFAIGDNGSISMGDEFDGMAVIVISPSHLLAFPKTRTAVELMEKIGMTNQESKVVYLNIENDLVALINEKIIDRAFEYYIDPNP